MRYHDYLANMENPRMYHVVEDGGISTYEKEGIFSKFKKTKFLKLSSDCEVMSQHEGDQAGIDIIKDGEKYTFYVYTGAQTFIREVLTHGARRVEYRYHP